MSASLYLDLRPPAAPETSGQRVLSFVFESIHHQVEPVVVFVDYENIRLSCKNMFQVESGDFDPYLFAEMLVGRRRRVSKLREVRVYRTVADPVRDPRRARRDMRRIRRWMRHPRLVFVGRPLKYHGAKIKAHEKGIDIALAIDVLVSAMDDPNVAVIVASRDSDFEPLVETLMYRKNWKRHVEVVSVTGMSRITIPATDLPWCHYLSREDFELIRDDAD